MLSARLGVDHGYTYASRAKLMAKRILEHGGKVPGGKGGADEKAVRRIADVIRTSERMETPSALL